MRNLAARMFLTFFVALVAFGAVALFAIGRMHALGTDLRLLSEGYLPLTRIAAQIEVKDWATARALELTAMEPAARRVLLPVARAHFPAIVKEKLAEARTVVAHARTSSEGSDARFFEEIGNRIEALDAKWSAYDAAARELYDTLERAGGPSDDGRLAERAEAARRLERSLSLDVKLLQAALDGQVADRVHAAERAERRSALLIVIYTLMAAMVGVGAMLIGQRLLAPIRILTEGVKAVAAGDLSGTVDVRSSDELGVLAREFNAMAASLARQRTELLRAERLAAVGRISAQITHEIRNPLNSIGLNTELLADEIERLAHRPVGATAASDDSISTVELRTIVQAIGREVDRLNAVAEEYLGFARLPRPVFLREDLNDIVAGLTDFVRPELEESGVSLDVQLAASLPSIRGDEAQLRAALLNLLRNSREAMPAGGSVTVTTRASDGYVEAEVRDTGAGIPAEALPRIFDAFYSTKEKGTGLGLAFTQQVVQEHGGSITCDSAPGDGTSFRVRLPAVTDERPSTSVGVGEALKA